MTKDTLMGILVFSPLFGLFAVFFAAIYFRSRYNRTHPATERTPAQRLRGKIIGWTLYIVMLLVGAYLLVEEDRFKPSWTITFFVGLAAFVIGESLGRRNGLRQADGKSKPAGPLVL